VLTRKGKVFLFLLLEFFPINAIVSGITGVPYSSPTESLESVIALLLFVMLLTFPVLSIIRLFYEPKKLILVEVLSSIFIMINIITALGFFIKEVMSVTKLQVL